MKRIDMAAGEPARPCAAQQPASQATFFGRSDARYPEGDPSIGAWPEVGEALPTDEQQADQVYAFWNALFSQPSAQLRQRLIELDALRFGTQDIVLQTRLDAAIHALEFVLHSKRSLPDAGASLL